MNLILGLIMTRSLVVPTGQATSQLKWYVRGIVCLQLVWDGNSSNILAVSFATPDQTTIKPQVSHD